MQKPFVITAYAQKFYSSHWFLKNQMISLFPIVKMNANYVEICRVGIFEANSHNIVVKQ